MALPVVFEALGLPITGAEADARVLSSVHRVRRIGGESPATFFSCPGAYGNVASSGDVYLSLRTQVVPADATASVLRMQVDAKAHRRTGSSNVLCTSTGSLEKLIAETLAARLQNV